MRHPLVSLATVLGILNLFSAGGLLCVHALVVPIKPGGGATSSPLFLGLDLSTQSVTGAILDEALQPVVPPVSVNFDARFPEFNTVAGMSVGDNGVVTSPVQMWLRATDALLDELRDTGLLERVACISCSGQQHGSVYWSQLGLDALANPHATATGFADALSNPGCFALGDSPIWADSSTQQVPQSLGAPARASVWKRAGPLSRVGRCARRSRRPFPARARRVRPPSRR